MALSGRLLIFNLVWIVSVFQTVHIVFLHASLVFVGLRLDIVVVGFGMLLVVLVPVDSLEALVDVRYIYLVVVAVDLHG